MSAVTIDMTVVVTQKNLAICWETRVSDSTHLEALPPSSENLFSADNQQATCKINYEQRVLRDYTQDIFKSIIGVDDLKMMI